MKSRLRLIIESCSLALIGLGLIALLQYPLARARPLAGTIVPGGQLTANTTWTLAGSPYVVQTSIVIPGGLALTIEPGVEVELTSTIAIAIQSGGTLNAPGTAAQPIIFTVAPGPGPGYWEGIWQTAGGQLYLNHCIVDHAGHGGFGAAGLILYGSDAQVQNCTIQHSEGTGIYLGTQDIAPILQNVAVLSSGGQAVYQATLDMNPTYQNLALSGNGEDAVVTACGAVGHDLTLDGRPAALNGSPIHILSPVDIFNGATLTVTPGTEVGLAPGNSFLYVEDGSTLSAEGTAAQPITFTSALTSPQPGDWRGLVQSYTGRLRLNHCTLAYGGNFSNEALALYGSDAQVQNCTIQHSLGAGIYLATTNMTPTLQNVAVLTSTSSAIYQMTVDMNPTYRNLTLDGNGDDAVAVGDGNVATDLTLDGSPAALNGRPIHLLSSLAVASNYTLTVTPGTTVEMDPNRGVAVTPYSTLVALGTPDHPITFTGSISNPAAGSWNGIDASALGTVRLAYCDIGYGGGSGGGTQANLNLHGANAGVDHCRIHHSQTDGVRTTSARVPRSMVYNTIEQNQHCGVYHVYENPAQILTLRYNAIGNNAGGGVCNEDTGMVIDAHQNFWGDATGPYHPTLNPNGLGNAVSDNVQFDPWLQQPVVGLIAFEPQQGGNVGSTTVRFYGIPNNPSLQIALRRAGQSDVMGVYRGASVDADGIEYTFVLSGTSVGSGQFVVTSDVSNPRLIDAAQSVLPVIPGTFSVVTAPPDATEQAAEKVFINVNARTRVHVGTPVAVNLLYGNNGLVDTPPTEFRIYSPVGLTVKPPQQDEYTLANVNATDWLSDTSPVTNTYANQAGFIRAGLPPQATSLSTMVFVPTRVGDIEYRIESVSSPAFAPLFDQPHDPSLTLSANLNTITDTQLTGSFNLQGTGYSGGGNLSIERLGPTDYFTPTVEVITSSTQITYVLTAAIPSPAVQGHSFGAQGGSRLEKIREFLEMVKDLPDQLARVEEKFSESEKLRLRRLETISCLLRLGIYKNDEGTQLRISQLQGFGDAGKLASNLNTIMQELLSMSDDPRSKLFSAPLNELDPAINALYDFALRVDLKSRLIADPDPDTKINLLGQVLDAQNGWPGHPDYYKGLTDEQLQRAITELCFKNRPQIKHIATGVISAFDPNDKSGTRGDGSQHHISLGEGLSYAIAFENVLTATAPAQTVTISDTLDTSKLDLSTLRLGGFIFSDTVSSAGIGLLPFVKDIDLRPQRNLVVRVEADLVLSHTLVWRFTSLDPATYAVPEDAAIGFLPPNANGTEGQGSVVFTIKPRSNLPDRTVISNTARIIFDNNAPMDTPTWTNMIWWPKVYLPLIRR